MAAASDPVGGSDPGGDIEDPAMHASYGALDTGVHGRVEEEDGGEGGSSEDRES